MNKNELAKLYNNLLSTQQIGYFYYMDSNLPNEQLQEKQGDRNYTGANEFQIYTNERHTKKDSTKKKLLYKKGFTADDQIPPHSTFQIPQKDRNRHLKLQSDIFGNSTKYNGKQHINPEQELSSTKNNNPSVRYDQDVNYLPTAPFEPSLRNERFDNRKNIAQAYETEQITNQVNYNAPTIYSNSNTQETNRGVVSELPNSGINKNSSLICRAINHDGKPVTVNDQVIKDKLILSCRPRTYYGPEGYLNRTVEVDRGRIPNYLYPPPQVSVIDNINIEQTTDIDRIRQYQQNRAEELEYLNTTRKSFGRSNAYDMGSLGLGDQGLKNEKQNEKYEEQYRVVQCKRYMRTFKTSLWGLFIINLLLLVSIYELLNTNFYESLLWTLLITVISYFC